MAVAFCPAGRQFRDDPRPIHRQCRPRQHAQRPSCNGGRSSAIHRRLQRSLWSHAAERRAPGRSLWPAPAVSHRHGNLYDRFRFVRFGTILRNADRCPGPPGAWGGPSHAPGLHLASYPLRRRSAAAGVRHHGSGSRRRRLHLATRRWRVDRPWRGRSRLASHIPHQCADRDIGAGCRPVFDYRNARAGRGQTRPFGARSSRLSALPCFSFPS